MLATALMAMATSAIGAPVTGPFEATARQPGILVLAVDDITQPYVRLIDDGFRDVVLAGRDAPAVYFESLDASRFGVAHAEQFRSWLAQKYQGRRIDVVVPLGEPAVAFLAANHAEPWQDAQVLYLEAGGVSKELLQAVPHATGLVLDEHVSEALEVVRQVLPDTRHVALVIGGTPIDQGRWGGFSAKVRAAGLEPIVISGVSFEQMLASVSHLPSHTVVYILAPMVDASGEVLGRRPCEQIAAAANVPAFTLGAHDFGCGVVGGLMRDWSIVGRLLGKRAIELLERVHAVEPVVRVPIAAYTTRQFDDRQLVRWHIDESRLPPGSTVLYRPHTLWTDYRAQVLSVVTAGALAAVLLGVILVERHRRHRAELEAQKHLVVAAHLDRRAAMGELTTSLAHELNQPLNAILQNAGVADLLLASDGDGRHRGELQEIVADIRSDNLRASEVIRRMRALLQKRELETRPVDPNALARETVALVRADAKARDIRLDLQLADEIRPVTGDRVHLQQVLLNLLLNAVDAVTAMPADRRSIVVRTVFDNGQAQIAVEDRGAGIRADSLQQIFEPFYSTKGEGMGMGMGLAIAKGIVDAHNGRLIARNNADGGATVSFSIPMMKVGAA